MNNKAHPEAIEVGVVGLGLMGTSIIVSLLVAGHKVKAIAPRPADMELARSRILDQLEHCRRSDLVAAGFHLKEDQLVISQDYRLLKNCAIVLECVIEDLEIKSSVYKKIAGEI